jgi:hypothetical protein
VLLTNFIPEDGGGMFLLNIDREPKYYTAQKLIGYHVFSYRSSGNCDLVLNKKLRPTSVKS